MTGLWKHVKESGRSVSMEHMSGKAIAVDASIWLNQSIAIRDVKGGF